VPAYNPAAEHPSDDLSPYFTTMSLFFEFDEGDKSEHSKKIFRRRTRLYVRKFVFDSRVAVELVGQSQVKQKRFEPRFEG